MRFGHQEKIFEHLADLAKHTSIEVIRQYLSVIATPYYEGAMLAYKRGNLDKAEMWWLKVFDIQPVSVSHRLAILYRKQHRYKDLVDMYIKALKYAQTSYIYLNTTQENSLLDEKNKAGELLLKNLNNDQSKGFRRYSSLVDQRFIKELGN